MDELRRIKDGASYTALADAFLEAADPRQFVPIAEAQCEVVRHGLDMVSLDLLVDETIRAFEPFDTGMDNALAVRAHEVLRITRREAADRNLWAWLGLVRYPHLVAHRWKPGAKTGLRSPERFVGERVRQTFSRLWWAGELTVDDEGEYELTRLLFSLRGIQDVYEALFGRAFSQYRPALAAFIKVVGPKREEVVRETAKELGYLLTTLVLEALDEQQLRVLLDQLCRQVEIRLQSR